MSLWWWFLLTAWKLPWCFPGFHLLLQHKKINFECVAQCSLLIFQHCTDRLVEWCERLIINPKRGTKKIIFRYLCGQSFILYLHDGKCACWEKILASSGAEELDISAVGQRWAHNPLPSTGHTQRHTSPVSLLENNHNPFKVNICNEAGFRH